DVLFFITTSCPLRSRLFPYTTLFRSSPVTEVTEKLVSIRYPQAWDLLSSPTTSMPSFCLGREPMKRCLETVGLETMNRLLAGLRSQEHTSELQSRGHLVCGLLLEIKN